jgi:hypothetical protein
MFVVSPVAGSEPPPDEVEAARLFAQAESAYAKHDYARAAEAFELANRTRPSPAVRLNAALAWEKAGDKARAATLLERYLSEAPAEAKERAPAAAMLASLRRLLGSLEVHAVDVGDVRIDGAPVDSSIVYVSPGQHVATARSQSVVVRRSVAIAAGDRAELELSPPPITPPVTPPEAAVTSQPPPTSHSGLSPWFVVAGGALAAIGGGVALVSAIQWGNQAVAVDALGADRTSSLQQRSDALDELRDTGLRRNWALGIGAGLVVATAAVALFLVDWKKPLVGTSHPSSAWALGDRGLHGAVRPR